MSLLSYREARSWSRAIKEKVVSREMPPWHAAPGGLPIRNDRSLTEEQIDTIAAWADGGAPRGDEADLPPLPTFSDADWHHPSGRPPDHILPTPIEMQIPAEGELPYFTLYSQIPFEDDVFAEAIEMLPSNRSVVHHMSVNVTTLPEGTVIIDGQPYGPDGERLTDEEMRAACESASNVLSGSTTLICFVPGRGFEMFREGVAKRVPAKKYGSPKVHVGHFASLILGGGSSMLVSQSMITPMSADAEWRQSLRIRPPAFRLENHACAP